VPLFLPVPLFLKYGYRTPLLQNKLQARTMGNLQRYSFQCLLTINLFNEKIFLFLWLWYLVLFASTAISLLYWAIVTLSPRLSRAFINRHLALSEIPIDIKGNSFQVSFANE
jgi:hypothetical protein